MATFQKITTHFWFDKNAEEAARFYVSVFKSASIGRISHYGKAGQDIHKMPEGLAMTVEFTLEGQDFIGLNGGSIFKFSEAVSLVVNCENQEEIDYYWQKLSENGDPNAQQCGWLKDKFGLSWQIVPVQLAGLFAGDNPEKADRVMNKMLQMKKLVIKELEEA